ncbi:Scr1 family TA system antitoxin-like transcriptional regulator [Streptomyces sp. CLV115]|uniref:Scr1 family TA system antitoxin-like transcriptional regulator n=1 Tax=Streptomyces sp. CLV115 TaxID=3138502 RepID=UPI00406CBABB
MCGSASSLPTARRPTSTWSTPWPRNARVEHRTRRRNIFGRPRPTPFEAFVHEAALRRHPGTRHRPAGQHVRRGLPGLRGPIGALSSPTRLHRVHFSRHEGVRTIHSTHRTRNVSPPA